MEYGVKDFWALPKEVIAERERHIQAEVTPMLITDLIALADRYPVILCEGDIHYEAVIPAGNTLDCRHNPRWGTYEPENTIEIPQRYDRIYLSNPYPNPMPNLTDCRIFGTEIHSETGLSPSDHYGVTADLQF